MASLLSNGKQQFIDLLGRPLAGAKVYFYEPGTEIKKDTWQDPALTVPNTNPVVLDARGQATLWGSGSYRQVLKDRLGITIWDQIVEEPTDSLDTSIDSQFAGLRTDLGSDSGSAGIGFKSSGAGAVKRSVQDKLRDWLHVKDFGAVCDGIVDDTAAVTAAHIVANAAGRSVSYVGIDKIALQANAQIPVKTSVDFAGAEIVIAGGVVLSPSFSSFNTLYVITDDACPLQTVTGAISAANLAEGSLFPTLGLFDGHGYAKVTAGLQVPNRDMTGTMSYTQAFKVNRNGRVSQPLSTDLSAWAAAITINYRKTSKKRLKLENISLTEGAWNNQRIFRIERCNVEVNNFPMLFNATGAFNNVCELISIDNASDIYINNFVTTGRPVWTTTGSYCLAIYGGADIYVDKMNALTGWGATGTDDVNGLHFTRSVLNRIDCHSSGHNIFADNCDLHETGMTYGWGGGVLSVKNSLAHRCPVITKRQDYGGTFFGSLVVDSVEVNNNFTSAYTVVDLATDPLGASTPVYAPKAIEVSNLKRIGKANGSNAELIPVAIKVKDAGSVVYAPARIKVADISCSFPSWRFGLRVDTMNMEAFSSTFPITKMLVSNCFPDIAATGASSNLTTGILEYDAIRTPATPVRPNLIVTNADNIGARIRNAANVDIRMNGVGINALQVDTASATQPAIVIDACRLFTAAAGFANAPVGGTTSGSTGYTTIRNSEVGAALFDLSLVAALQGITIRKGANQPLLPAGVTAAQAFTGWQKAGMFS